MCTGTYSTTVGATSNGTCAPCNAGEGRFCPLGSSSAAGIWCPAAYYCTGGISDKQACPAGESSFSLSLPPFLSLSRALSLHGWHQRLSSVPRALVLLDDDRCVRCVSVCLCVCVSVCLCVWMKHASMKPCNRAQRLQQHETKRSASVY
jgi:hypothetical protein